MLAMLFVLTLLSLKTSQAAVTIYNAPSGLPASDKYSVSVDNNNSFVYKFDNYDSNNPSHHLTYFAMTGTVTVKVRKLSGNIGTIKVRPSNWGINPSVSGDTATFTLSSPRNLSVEIDGDIRTPLYLFANAPETNAASPTDSTVTYFGPGYTDASNITPKSKVYIAGGAVVAGLRTGGDTPTVWGHGILAGYDGKQSGLRAGEVSISFKDFILVKSHPGWQMYLENVSGNINNVKILGANWVDDGMDLNRCHDLTIDGVFIKTQDDNIAIKNYKWDQNANPQYYPGGDTKNLVVKNSTLFCGAANNLEIGHETVGGAIDGLQFINNDVLHGSGRNAHGALAIHLAGDTAISNITYDNIRAENLSASSYLINVVIAENQYSFARGRGTITGLTYKNINYLSGASPLIYFQGADDTHKIKNVTFDGLKILGNTISSPSDARIRFPQYVENVKFSPTATTSYSSQPSWKILTNAGYMAMYDAIDNDFNTLWESSKNDTSDWVTVNLSSGPTYQNNSVAFDRVEVYGSRFANAAGLNIMVSNDGSNWTSVPVTNTKLNDADGYPVTCRATFSSQTAKYVRISPSANQPYGNNWHVYEVKVFNGNNAVDLSFPPASSSTQTTVTNLVSNPSFDAEAYDTQTPSGWSEWSSLGGVGAGYTESYGGTKSGARHGTHWSNSPYNIYTYQTKTGLSNGLYTLRTWTKSSSASSQIEAKEHGNNSSKEVKALPVSTSAYALTEIKDINVTNGQCVIGFWTSSSGGEWLYFDDVEFFKQDGTTTPPANSTPTKLSGTATASSSENTTNSADKAVDNNSGTRWASASSDPQWITVDLGATKTITQVKLNWETAAGKDYKIQVSNSTSGPWTDIKTVTGNTSGGWKDYTSLSGSGRYVRMYGTARATSWGYSLFDFEVYGY